MRLLDKTGSVEFYLLEPQDATPALAQQIMRVQRNAYKSRYPKVPVEEINRVFKTDLKTDIRVTIQNLRAPYWYWVVAKVKRNIVCFGVFGLGGDETIGLHVYELHTDPSKQNQRVATWVLWLGLQRGLQRWQCEWVTICVGKAFAADRHPTEWYKNLNFVQRGRDGSYQLGAYTVKKYTLRAKMSDVLFLLNLRKLNMKGS